MSRFWLTYQSADRLFGVVIVDSSSLTNARIRAAGELDLQAEFAEGHQIEEAVATLVPLTAMDRMLSPNEAHDLLDRIEREIPKREAAPSMQRDAVRSRRA